MFDFLEKGQTKNSLNQLCDIAEQYGASVHEFLLWADKETVVQRLEDRGFVSGGMLTPEKAEQFWEEMNKFKETRKQAILIDTNNLSPDEVFEQVWGKIEA